LLLVFFSFSSQFFSLNASSGLRSSASALICLNIASVATKFQHSYGPFVSFSFFFFSFFLFIFIFYCFMLNHRSLSLPLNSCDLEIERTLRQLRSEKNSNLLEERLTKTIDENNHMALKDHYLPTTYTSLTCLRLPDVTAAHYEIKPSTIQILPSFLGLSTENLYDFLDEFLTICSTIKLSRFTEDALRVCLFPFPLKERAKHCFHSLISTKFYYFLGSIATRISKEIFSNRKDQ